MSEPEKKPELPPEEVQNAESAILCDCIQRLAAGRSLRVVVNAVNSAIYNMAQNITPQSREFLTINLVQLSNDILMIDNEKDESQTQLPLN